MKWPSFLILLLYYSFSIGQSPRIVLTDDNLGNSFADQVLILEDKEHAIDLGQALALKDEDYTQLTHSIPNLDFTTSRYWVKISVTNKSSYQDFMLETARPITNVVHFYKLFDDEVVAESVSGDDYAFEEKTINHRKNLFELNIGPGQSRTYLLMLESDGEVISLPVKIHERSSFEEKDYADQWQLGFYYGLMLLVFIIYFFFYVVLRDITFLYYVMYVLFQGLLQFSLDGYSFQYFFPNGGYLANHFVLLVAGLTVVFVLSYVRFFLHLNEHSKKLDRVYKGFLILVFISIVLSLIPGATYEIAYPVINGLSLISIVLSVVAIYGLKLKGHRIDNFFAIGFTILIAGAVVFILGNFNVVGNAEISQTALKLSSMAEVVLLSMSMSNKYRDLQREKEIAQETVLETLREKNALMDEINVKLEKQVKERTAEIAEQKEILEEQNNEILSSIKYAKRIQEAILPSGSHVKRLLPDSFVFYLPKDVVSGDFYFVESTKTTTDTPQELVIFAAVDCTGHGVPGALMSVIGNNNLTQTLTEPTVNTTAQALEYLNKGVVKALRQDASETTTVRDGMDISLCALDVAKRKLYFSGAKNPVYIIRKGNKNDLEGLGEADEKNPLMNEEGDRFLFEIKGDKHPIGAFVGEELKPFTTHSVELREGDSVYLFSDGFADQFGGQEEHGKEKKYNYKRFKQLLLQLSEHPMDEQKKLLSQEFESWKGETEQLDDVLVMGVRIQ